MAMETKEEQDRTEIHEKKKVSGMTPSEYRMSVRGRNV